MDGCIRAFTLKIESMGTGSTRGLMKRDTMAVGCLDSSMVMGLITVNQIHLQERSKRSKTFGKMDRNSN